MASPGYDYLIAHRQQVSGEIDWVQIDIGDGCHDHLINPEDKLTIAMARQ